MAQRKNGLLERWKDTLEANRNKIVYTFLVLALLGTIVGWGMLPQQVLLFPTAGSLVPKNTALLTHLGICGLFTALFWKWPRELAYFLGGVLGLLLMFNVVAQNVGL